MSPNIEVALAPNAYDRSFCDAVRTGCAKQLEELDEKVKKVDNRIFALLLLGIGNLVTALGGAVGMIFYLMNVPK